MIKEAVETVNRKRRKISHKDRGENSLSLKVPFSEEEPLPPGSFGDPYHISVDQRLKVELSCLLDANRNDPAYKVHFISSSQFLEKAYCSF